MLVVSGASGQLGRATVAHLLDRGVDPTRLVLATRSPDTLAGSAPRGAQVRPADFDRPDGLRAAFAGGTRLLLISTDTITDRGTQHAAAIDAAREAGIGHVIYTSMIAPGPDNPALISASHRATEQHLRASGLAWTMLRCGLYADFQVFEAAGALASGRLVHNRGAGGCAYLARADCARAAAVVLAGDGHEGTVYDLTGPQALSATELAELYSSVGGRPVAAVPVGDDELLRQLSGDGDADGHVRYGATLTVSLGQAIRGGHFGAVSTAVQDLTGAAPAAIGDLLRAHRDTLRASA